MRCRRVQIRWSIVKLLIVFAIFVAASIGWYYDKMEDAAVSAFKENGATIKSDVDYDSNCNEIPLRKSALDRCFEAFGIRRSRPTVIDAQNSRASATDVRFIRYFRCLRGLYLLNVSIDESGFLAIATQDNLQVLVVGGSKAMIDVASLDRVSKLPLVQLHVIDCEASDADVARLLDMSTLRALDLGRTKITDQTGVQLARLNQLEYLCIEGTSISDASIDALATLTRLKIMRVGNTRISESRVRYLKSKLTACEIDW